MENSLLKEMDSKSLQSYLSEKDFGPFYWVNFFPMRSVLYLTYQTLIGSQGRPVAADFVAYDVSAPEKRRPIVSKLAGEIPAIKVSRTMDEMKLQEYDALQLMAKTDATHKQIMKLIFDDIKFVVDSVYARIEWTCLKVLNQQKLTLKKTTNQGIITETAIDFQLETSHKRVIKSTADNRLWTYVTTDSSKPKPITDIKLIVRTAKSAGIKLNYIVMNLTKFDEFSLCDEVLNYVKPWSFYEKTAAGSTLPAPTIEAVNNALKAHGLPEIIIIDQQINLEIDGDRTSVDPFLDDDGADKFVVFLGSRPCGEVLSGPITEESHKVKQVTYAKHGNILVSKYSETNPVKEWTVAQLNAFPSFPTIDTVYRLDTESGNATGIEA